MMAAWLPTDEGNMLPNPVSHYAGVGGLVQNGDGDVLLVSEKYTSGNHSGVWKLPGGLVNLGETLQVRMALCIPVRTPAWTCACTRVRPRADVRFLVPGRLRRACYA